jgi:membrane-associated protease RseP (regulator of RpoE activity)
MNEPEANADTELEIFDAPEVKTEPKERIWLHLLLFLLTLCTTTLAGLEWMVPGAFLGVEGGTFTWELLPQGLWFSVPFLFILSVHEFGHYGMARFHRARVSLPYYIPMWLGFLGMPTIGTLGAFIRIRSVMATRQQLFDVGAAGPLAGFLATLLVLAYGYTHLPPPEFIFSIHPEYLPYGLDYAKQVYPEGTGQLMAVGHNLTLWLFENTLVSDIARIPNQHEFMHYPMLFAGFMALFFTALNLFPIGQLDGGHILYGLVGPRWHAILSPLFFLILLTYSGLGMAQPISAQYDSLGVEKLQWNVGYFIFLVLALSKTAKGWPNLIMLALGVFTIQYAMAIYAPQITGYNGWLVFCFVLGRVLGIYHPPVLIDEPLSTGRKLIGYAALVVFLLSFSPEPFRFI